MAETQSIIALSCDDDFYISLLLSESENLEDDNLTTLLADEKYAHELNLQHTIMASFNDTTVGESSSSSSSSDKAGFRIKVEVGESSNFLCEICAEKNDKDEMFSFGHNNNSCSSHKFCKNCISKHITTKLVVNREKSPQIACPGLDCNGVLEIDTCGEILPKHVVVLWDEVICESVIPPAQRFYCPYKSCSGLLMNDCGDDVRECECPFCNRLFCLKCRVTWHSGVDCEEFSRLSLEERGREDLMVHELAKKNQWQRCPQCKFFVEKKDGCLHMTCRCEFQFCYACGAAWSSTHGGCQ